MGLSTTNIPLQTQRSDLDQEASNDIVSTLWLGPGLPYRRRRGIFA